MGCPVKQQVTWLGNSGMPQGRQLQLLRSELRRHIVNCLSTRPRDLITAFRLYGIAIDLTVAPANHRSYWLSLYSLLGTRRPGRSSTHTVKPKYKGWMRQDPSLW